MPADMTADCSADDGERLVRIAVAFDGDTAQRWAGALTEAGIDAHMRIEDATHRSPGGSFYPTGQLFAYPLLVAAAERDAAAAVLVDLGRDGPFGRSCGVGLGLALGGAAVALGAGLLVALVSLLRGG